MKDIGKKRVQVKSSIIVILALVAVAGIAIQSAELRKESLCKNEYCYEKRVEGSVFCEKHKKEMEKKKIPDGKDYVNNSNSNSHQNADTKSIAFPAISTGVYGYPKKEAAKVAVRTILNELKDMDSDFEVYLAAFDQETASLYNQEILEQANRKRSQEELSSIVSVCDKWMEKFTDADISYVELVDHYLADDCNTFGFEMDCGYAFQEKYKDAFNNLRTLNRVLDRIDDIDLLGSAIYSKWRYFNHWAYDAAEILSQPSRGWFVAILSRMKYLANKELMDRKDEIVDDTK